MRTYGRMFAALAVVGGLALLFAPGASGDIAGSAHDFSTGTWAQGQICLPCHTPHHAVPGEWPLWNHESTTATFTMYSSHAMDATAPTDVEGPSRKCLSCHDGTVAPDAFGGNAGTDALRLTGDSQIGAGADLTNHHPISINYLESEVDPEIVDFANLPSDIHLIPRGAFDPTVGAYVVTKQMLECGACHDVHDTYNQSDLLVKSNAGSALCLSCHIK